MVILIVLNIILIISVMFLALYLIKNKKDEDKTVTVKPVSINCGCDDDDDCENEIKHSRKRESKPEKVFIGRFITDEEYQQMSKSRRSDISILMEEVNKEYEHLKELINERTEGNNTR